MSLISRLFRKAPAEPSVAAAPATPVDAQTQRAAAIAQLPDGDELRTIAGVAGTPDDGSEAQVPILKRAAQIRMAQLIDLGSIDFSAFVGRTPDCFAMIGVVARCRNPEFLTRALASVGDAAELARLLVASPSSRVRGLAAQAISDPAQLKQLLKEVGGKDKNVYKILKQKCDALNAAERKSLAIASEMAAMLEALDRHSHRMYDAFYTAVLTQLQSRWCALEAPRDAGTQERFEQAVARCREVIAVQLREDEALAAAKAAQEAARVAERETRRRERQAAQEAATALAHAEAELQHSRTAALQAEELVRVQQRAAEQQALRQIGGLIRKADGALNGGNTQQAAGLRRAIEGRLSSAPAVPVFLARQLQHLDEKLNELKGWKEHAVAPKRIELIHEMEALIGAADEPKILAERIKSLQAQWRTISKGIVSDTPGDWESFHRASQAAYEPCREYFAAQAKIRQQNLEYRRAVLERLTAFEAGLDGENPDWRLMATVLREAPQELRGHSPVDREAGRAIQDSFDAAMGRLQLTLDGWHAGNLADKQTLIQRAQLLLAQQDSRAAIEAVKRLQVQWKDIGAAPRNSEQRLWNEFREACDAVYQKRQQAYADHAAGLEANKSAALALCEEAERIGESSGSARGEGADRLAQIRVEFEALEELPRSEARSLEDRLERAVGAYQARVTEQRARDAAQTFTNLFEAARYIRAYEWAVVNDATVAVRSDLRKIAENFITGVQRWPKGASGTQRSAVERRCIVCGGYREPREGIADLVHKMRNFE